jgi:ribonuclease HII
MSLLFSYHKNILEAGCDEAGRGCLAGPVVAASVILRPDKKIKGLNDSKKLSEKQRFLLRQEIESSAAAFAIGIVSNTEIDNINILQASFLAMHRAIEQLSITPEHLLIDGNRFKPYHQIPHTCIIKGDALYQSIAAASILAKTYRDELMDNLHAMHPHYHWDKNKGYPTINHRKAIESNGITPYHRKSFRLLPQQILMNL